MASNLKIKKPECPLKNSNCEHIIWIGSLALCNLKGECPHKAEKPYGKHEPEDKILP